MASIYDKASLVLIPSGTKTSKVYSQKPTNGDGDFTFSRSTAATRVNASGNIEKETQNLYIRSQEIENAIWSKARGSVTANATAAPDGTTTADLWTEDTSNGTHDIRQGTTTSSGSFYMFSIYAKANGRNVLDVYVGGANKSANFNLTTGLVTGGSAPIRKIEDVGSGWYRVSVGCLAASTTTTAIWILNNGSTQSYTGDGTSGMYFWGAQAEQSLVARDYIETTTTAIYGGITDNVPRLDYTDSSCPALLLEPQRTNLLPQSEYFGDSSWSKTSAGTGSNAIVTDNYGVSPEGLQNAARLQLNLNGGTSNSDISYIADYYTATGVATTNSIYMKSLSGTVNVRIRCGSTFKSVDVTTDWQRFDVTDSSTSDRFQVLIYGGINSDVADLLIWGAQGESGSYATSYIPTYGSAVTRNVDSCIKTGIADVFEPSNGTIFFEMSSPDNSSNSKVITIGSSSSERIQVFYYQDSIRLNLTAGGTSQAYLQEAVTTTDTIKVAVSYAANDVKLFVNGVLQAFDTSAAMPSALNYFRFDNGSGGSAFIGSVKQAIYFPTALTDQEAIDLTTI